MGAGPSTDEQKTATLAQENQQLKEELRRLKQRLGREVDSGADDSGGEGGNEEQDGGGSDEDNLSVEELITRGLRLQPYFDENGECVELVATVVDDIVDNNDDGNEEGDGEGEMDGEGNGDDDGNDTGDSSKKKKKKKNKAKKAEEKKKKKKALRKNKKHRPSSKRSKRPVITAQLEPDSLMHVVDVDEQPDIILKARSLKMQVLENEQKYNPSIKLISDASTIESLLEEELKKGEHSAFYLVNLGAIVEKWLQWSKFFPNIQPFYAMKSNPDLQIVRTLHLLGAGFDCASKAELDEAISVGAAPEKIIFANPCKGKEHIAFAKQIGVEMMTFDSMDELAKIVSLYPTAKLVLRILPDDSHSLMPFGTKFGASFKESCNLIAHAKKLGAHLMGVSFHVGSGCFSSLAWIDAISLARRVFDEAEKEGFDLTLLDIGGGWPGTDEGPLILEDICEAIGRHITNLFPPKVKIIAEPGRYFCTSSYTLAVTVTSRRERYSLGQRAQNKISTPGQSHDNSSDLKKQALHKAAAAAADSDSEAADKEEIKEQTDPSKEVLYYLSDGVYGSFNNIVFDHAQPSPATFKSSDVTRKSCLFGPTCDSIDVICKDIDLPELEIGDWLYFMNMGAYTVASASSFNGFKPPNAFYVVCIDNPKQK